MATATPLLDLDSAASKLGISSLKGKQREAITSFVDGHDVFVSLPTGYGKSLCYTLLPLVRQSQRCAVTAGICSQRYITSSDAVYSQRTVSAGTADSVAIALCF